MALDTGAVIALANRTEASKSLLETIGVDATMLVPAPVLTEVLRGGPKDAAVHRVLNALATGIATSFEAGRRAGELLGSTQSGPERTMDALIVETALEYGATAIATQDPKDIGPLLGGRAKMIPV